MFGHDRWPVLLGVAGAILFALATWTLIQGLGGWNTSFEGPGSLDIDIPGAGDYRLWHESKTTIDGRLQVVDDELPPGSTIEFTDERGETIPLQPARGSMSQEVGSTRRVALGSVEVADAGTYTVTVTGFDQPRRFRLSEIRFFDHLLRALAFALPGTILTSIALIWGIVTASRRRRPKA